MCELLAAIILSLVSSVGVMLVSDRRAKQASIILTIIVALLLVSPILRGIEEPYYENYVLPGLHQIGADLTFRVDSLSALFLAITGLIFIAVAWAASWEIEERAKLYLALMFTAEAALIGVFASWNLFWFYLFWEFTLLPMFIHILYWGGERKVYAAYKFFVYTQIGGMMLLVAIALGWLYGSHTFDMKDFAAGLSVAPEWVKAAFAWLTLLAFFIKVPVPPFHTWLPAAHVEAPSPSSVILASLMLKMGGYAFIRITLGIVPYMLMMYLPFIAIWAALAAAYAATVAIAQVDFKRVVAYTSISHMSMSTIGAAIWGMGIGNASYLGFVGSVFEMISHSFVVGALFLLSGVIKHYLHTREIPKIRGLAFVVPIMSTVIMIAIFAGFGLPGTSGYPAELSLVASSLGMAKQTSAGTIVAAFLLLAIATVTGYLVWDGQRMLFTRPPVKLEKDVKFYHIGPILYLLAISVIIGIMPHLVMGPLKTAVTQTPLALTGVVPG
ncbi:NADH:ubiquinone oxidoreductase subunit M [Ignicoccus islandicus DSM 13165]|uniref:NADH:ubiquinone oxidoreductase subunit M n=1 Tax=Ignicoccus islandicus DSM 13165 TaxID=940295 RepID=A0A0U3E846_9CREN|nr:NADH-quinone oxidoreductase subunit M [Ignicoccus islandicus]ALU11534.1 NADH:ubiquinone oxidoreductase subunit M [Ignicoccus islandicus DSM 13165]